MTTLDHSSLATRIAVRPNAVARMVAALANVWNAAKNRREIYRLGELSDTELADIGLTRADLHVAVGHPLGTDPTASLSMIVRRRQEDLARSVC